MQTVIEVCVGLHCCMKGSYAILESIRKHYVTGFTYGKMDRER